MCLSAATDLDFGLHVPELEYLVYGLRGTIKYLTLNDTANEYNIALEL